MKSSEQKIFAKSFTTRGVVLKENFVGNVDYIDHGPSRFRDAAGDPSSINATYKGDKGEANYSSFVINQMRVVSKEDLKKIEEITLDGKKVKNVYTLESIESISGNTLGRLMKENEYTYPETLPIIGAAIILDDDGSVRHSSARRYVGFNAWAKTMRDNDEIPTLPDFLSHLKKEDLKLEDKPGFKESNLSTMTAIYILGDETDIKMD